MTDLINKASKSLVPSSKAIVYVIVSYWARVHSLSNISVHHITSKMLINIIYGFTKPTYFMEMAEQILSLDDLTPEQRKLRKDYTKGKPKHLQYIVPLTNISRLCDDIEPVLSKEATLVQLNINKNTDQKMIIFGSIYGDLFSLLEHFNTIREDKTVNIIHKITQYNDIYLFLGAYVSRGQFTRFLKHRRLKKRPGT
eukprot:895863_1